MRVAYILNNSSLTNGATKAFLSLLRGLMKKGVEPLVVMSDKGELYDVLSNEGIEVVVMNYRRNSYAHFHTWKNKLQFIPKMLARLVVNHRCAKALSKLIVERNVDIVHTNTSTISVGHYAAKRVGVPHVFHFREFADKIGHHFFPSRRCFNSEIMHSGDHTICITKGVQQHLNPTGAGHSIVAYDGVISENTPVVTTERKEDYLLCAGRVDPSKGLDIVLDALALMAKERGVESVPMLKVAGAYSDNEYFRQCKGTIEANNLQEKVQFLGERTDIAELMQKARALVMPSRFEGFGLCMPEAMVNDCLCLGNDTTGTKEQFDNGVALTGQEIGFRFTTPEELKVHIEAIAATDADEYAEMRRRANTTVRALYTIEKNIVSVYTLYETILNTNKSRL